MELTWYLLIPVAGSFAVLYAGWLARYVLSQDAGTAAMQEIGGMIFEGAMAFLTTPVPDDRHLRVADGRR